MLNSLLGFNLNELDGTRYPLTVTHNLSTLSCSHCVMFIEPESLVNISSSPYLTSAIEKVTALIISLM